jgi:hypothetical protein
MEIKHRARRLALAVAAGLCACGIWAGSANAAVEHYCQGASLLAGWLCSGSQPHQGTASVWVTSNHTACATVALGIYAGGTTGSPNGAYFSVVACTNGSGTYGGSVGLGSGTNYYGGVWNPNQSTTDNISDAHISG